MKNKEKFAKEILDIACSGYCIALAKGKPVPCDTILCTDCYFNKNGTCKTKLKEWAESEYEEPKIQPEVKECKVDDRILVSTDGIGWVERHFAKYDAKLDEVFAWYEGGTSWTKALTFNWPYAKLPEREGVK